MAWVTTMAAGGEQTRIAHACDVSSGASMRSWLINMIALFATGSDAAQGAWLSISVLDNLLIAFADSRWGPCKWFRPRPAIQLCLDLTNVNKNKHKHWKQKKR